MAGDNALSSNAALILSEFSAKSADNFAMKRRSGGRQFKSILLPPSSISIFGHLRESFEIRVHTRDLRTCADPENLFVAQSWPNLAKPIPARFA
jgi:hypothetical protein